MGGLQKAGRSIQTGTWITAERIGAHSLILIALWVVALALFWSLGAGLTDPRGEPIGTDFINPYAAGRLALEGRPEAAYDWDVHAAMEQAIVGRASDSYYGWHYPPIFLLVAAALATLPYLAALGVWLATTFALYLAAIRAILPRPLALLAAAAAPTTFITIGHGQNAFLTAGLLGLGLALLDRRPLAAGLLLGCLSYKPHFGLLLPVVLAAGGHWRAFLGAAIAVVALSLAALAAFGIDAWSAFLDSREATRTIVLEGVAIGWFRIQSLFAFLRGSGASLAIAYAAQGIVSIAALAVLAWTWRRDSGPAARSALCAGALLVTPYVLDYDLALLAPAVAFLVADGMARGFRPYEKTLLVAAAITPLVARMAAEHLHLPLGLAASAMVFALAASRPSQHLVKRPA